jgi:hypothetical protein
MSRWLERALAAVAPDLARVPNVPNVPKARTASRFGTFGTNGTQNHRSVSATAGKLTGQDHFEERAAVIEEGARVPREWAEGFARLNVMEPPLGFSLARWQQLIDDGGRFLDMWGNQAAALGWRVEDVFGVDGVEPETGYGAIGLVAMIRGGAVTCVTKSMAVVEQHEGELLVYLRRRSREATLVWHLLDRCSPAVSKRE